jgi:hypothetical protein
MNAPFACRAAILYSVIIMFGFTKLFGQKSADDFPPKPKWKPNVPVDINVVADRAAYYTDHKKTIVIFRNGTCVVLPAESSQPKQEAVAVLNAVFNYHPDFNPQKMDDGNFAITFSKPNCFAVVTNAEFEKNKDYIVKNHLDGVVKDEVLLNAKKEPNVFDDRGMIGLFGRARMFLDAQDPVVVKIIEAEKGG